MNSLKNMFRPTKPISKNISFKPDELVSNSQKVSTYSILVKMFELLTKMYVLVDVGTWSY